MPQNHFVELMKVLVIDAIFSRLMSGLNSQILSNLLDDMIHTFRPVRLNSRSTCLSEAILGLSEQDLLQISSFSQFITGIQWQHFQIILN